ncbi:hypothetical protein GCM10022224_052420 [Nonomuraea antimicrobica]|uniref:Uncharacterized protein n=2 Tax=Nonomuraea antimicrobica TaxID=561173 RepID=A0ABP7C6L6_9ACTN
MIAVIGRTLALVSCALGVAAAAALPAGAVAAHDADGSATGSLAVITFGNTAWD